MNKNHIDAVIAWVDGDDIRHRMSRNRYSGRDDLLHEDIGGESRYISLDEIKYCVGSILRYATYIHRIFIVTDQQIPPIEPFIHQYFPKCNVEIKIIDHKEIFRGYEEYLPTFNSLSIETMLWRIPDLSERYIYFNDDVMLVAPTSEQTFFEGRKPICYAKRYPLLFAKFLRWIKPKNNGHKPFGFKDAMVNSADVLNHRWTFPYIGHFPHPQNREILSTYYKSNEQVLRDNIKHRFRAHTQYNPQVLCYILGLNSGQCILKSPKGIGLYLKPKPKKDYVKNHLKAFDRNKEAIFLCVNSLDKASEEDQGTVLGWLLRRITL